MLHVSDDEASSSDDDSVQFMIPLFCDCGRARKRDCEFNTRIKHDVPPKLALAPSQDIATASPVHVRDICRTRVDPPPSVSFSLSPTLGGRKRL